MPIILLKCPRVISGIWPRSFQSPLSTFPQFPAADVHANGSEGQKEWGHFAPNNESYFSLQTHFKNNDL